MGKDDLVDEDLLEELAMCEPDVKLGDHALLSEHLNELANHRDIKLKIMNNEKIFVYASK